MAFTPAGIKEVYIAPGGAAFPGTMTIPPAAATDIFGMGIRRDGTFNIAHFNEMEDNRGRKFPSMLNFKAEFDSYQIGDLFFIEALHKAAKAGGVDTAIVTAGAAKNSTKVESLTGGLFLFDKHTAAITGNSVSGGGTTTLTMAATTHGIGVGQTITISGSATSNLNASWKVTSVTGASVVIDTGSTSITVNASSGGTAALEDNSLGIDFELVIAMKERYVKLTLERAFKYDEGRGLVDAASRAQIPFTASGVPMINDAKVMQGFLSPTFIPSALSATFADINLADFKITVKTESQKNAFNSAVLSNYSVMLEAAASGPNAADIREILKYEVPADVVVTLISGKTLTFATKGLSRIGSAEIGDAKREGRLLISGEYDPDFVVVGANDIKFNTFLQ